MTKNGLAPEENPSTEPPPKRQRLAPPSTSSSSSTNPQHSSSSANLPNIASKMEEDSSVGVVNQMITINADDRERELEVGIEHFVNTAAKGFSGVLKQRYTDFLVNEIALDGTVMHLKNDRAPSTAAAVKVKEKALRKELHEEEDARLEAEAEAEAEIKPGDEIALPTAVETEAKPGEGDAVLAPEAKSNEQSAKDVKTESAATEKPTETAAQPDSHKDTSESKVETTEEAKAATAATDVPFSISPEDEAALVEYFGAAFKDELLRFHEKILAKPNAKHNSFGSITSPPFTDRVARGRMHGDMRRIFSSRLETVTVDEGIMISAASKNNRSWQERQGTIADPAGHSRGKPAGSGRQFNQSKGKLGWQELGGEYLHFNLYKENKDTMEVTSFLARLLHIKPKDFSFAGTKDRRAVTVQQICVFRQHAKDLARYNSQLRQAKIGDFKYEKFPLKLGHLNGNLFTIALRDCHFEGEDHLDQDGKMKLANEILKTAIEHFGTHGFLNYFGLQRFGTFGIGTHDVGKLILKDDFEGAVKAILTYNHDLLNTDPASTDRVGRDDIARARAIHHFEQTGNSRAREVEDLPRKYSAECAIIRHLGMRNSRRDFAGALQQIHRNLRTMYVHAYQSLVWNMAASKRWELYGSEVIEGDLVMIEAGQRASGFKDEVDQNGEVVIHPADHDAAIHLDDMFERARPLTAEEAKSGKYTIFDIVLPTPGFDIEYPANNVGDFYKEFMASELGGGLDPANMRRRDKDFSLSGNYRKLLSQVKDLSFELKWYHSDTESLTETDLEILEKSRPKQKENENAQQRNGGDFYQRGGNNNRGRGRGNFFDNGGRGGRGGYGQNSRGNGQNARGGYGQNDRGRYNNNESRGGSRIYRDVRLEEAEEAAKLAQQSGDTEQQEPPDAASSGVPPAAALSEVQENSHGANLRAWNALPAKLAAENAANLETAQRRRDEEPAVDTSNIVLPDLQETFIQTGVDDSGRRNVVSKKTTIVGMDGATGDAVKEGQASIQNPALAAATDVDMKDVEEKVAFAPTDEQAEAVDKVPEVPALPNADRPFSPNSTDSTGGVALEPKLAVIVTFALGPSQYATMALRELLKAGGVKTYKPDYSSGR